MDRASIAGWGLAAILCALLAWQVAAFLPHTATDAPSHAYNAHVYNALNSGTDTTYSGYYAAKPLPQPNVGALWLLAALQRAFGIAGSLVVLHWLLFAFTAAAVCTLLVRWGAAMPAAFCLSAPLLLSFPYLMGFHGYMMSFALSLIWFAALTRPRIGALGTAALALIGVAMYVFHPLPLFVCAGALVLHELLRRFAPAASFLEFRIPARAAAISLAPGFALAFYSLAASEHQGMSARSLAQMAKDTVIRIYEWRWFEGVSYAPEGMVFLVAGIGGALIWQFAAKGWREAMRGIEPAQFALAVLAALAFVFSFDGLMRGEYVVERMEMYVYLCAIALVGRLLGRSKAVALAAIVILPHTLLMTYHHRKTAAASMAEIAELRQATREIPRGARVAALHDLTREEIGVGAWRNASYGKHAVTLLAAERGWLALHNYEGFVGHFPLRVKEPAKYRPLFMLGAENPLWREQAVREVAKTQAIQPEWIVYRNGSVDGEPACVGACVETTKELETAYEAVVKSPSGRLVVYRRAKR